MADYLTDEEQAERLKRLWDRYGTALVAGLAIAVAGVVGWRYYQDYLSGRAEAAAAAFATYVEARTVEEAIDSVEEASDDDAPAAPPDALREAAATLDADHAGTSHHVLSLLYRAADQAQEEDWAECLAFLERAIELADDGPLLDIARYRAAKVLFQLDRVPESEAMLAGVRSSGLEPQVAELSGDLALAKGDLEAARAAYRSGIDAAEAEGEGELPGVALLELKLASVVDEEA